MIKRILIANRGEIVDRVIRTCKKVGIESVVIYSEADKFAPYVSRADKSVCVGPANPVKSYLNIDAIIDAAQSTQADAVHPGYGFLSERGSFAESVESAGMVWIGPPAEILRSISSKCYCRQIANEVGVPIIPGSLHPIKFADELKELGERLGWPLFLKLDKGGGGKGIEKVTESDDFENVVRKTMSVGNMAFGSPDCYVEAYINNPKHIEVQFLSDKYHNCICLGERECSLQRRNQKIIEESPSSVVNDNDREYLYAWTNRIVQELGYIGAGTIEYLRSPNGNYYFLEINARLQVEHPVSEFVTGIDIVENQIDIGNQKELSLRQKDIILSGHSIESRVYAEDPKTFIPSPGKITKLTLPELTNNIRIDHALAENYTVPPYYDPLLCKVITWENDRYNAVKSLIETLEKIDIEGVSTTIPLSLKLLELESFMNGNYDVTTVDDFVSL